MPLLPTTRLLTLLLLAAPAGAFGGLGGGLAALLVLLALAAAWLDWRRAGGLGAVQVTRTLEEKLSLGQWNPVVLALENRSRHAQRLLVRDLVPPDFAIQETQALPGVLPATLGPRARLELRYHVRPARRGDYRFGPLYLRVTGPLGLVRRQRRVAGSERAVRVYPDLRQLRRYELLVRRGMQTEAGARPVRVAGAGTELERLREYLPDDEFRRVNWKATARRGTPIVTQLEAERSQNVVLMIDSGRLMGARADLPVSDEAAALLAGETPTGSTKLDYALNAALLLAYVASVRGDRLALLTYTDRVERYVPPGRGRHAFLTVVQAFYNLQPAPVEPDHGAAFQFIAARSLRRSLVVLFTDLADRESSAGLVAHALRAARQHMVVSVTLRDPTVALPALAMPGSVTALYQKLAAQRLLDERAAVLSTLGAHGVLSVDADADALSPQLIGAYLDLKQRGRI